MSGRQKKSSHVDTKSQGVYPIKATNISISHLIEIVNSTHQSILSDDVLNQLGEQRNPGGYYSNKVLFSERNNGPSAYEFGRLYFSNYYYCIFNYYMLLYLYKKNYI